MWSKRAIKITGSAITSEWSVLVEVVHPSMVKCCGPWEIQFRYRWETADERRGRWETSIGSNCWPGWRAIQPRELHSLSQSLLSFVTEQKKEPLVKSSIPARPRFGTVCSPSKNHQMCLYLAGFKIRNLHIITGHVSNENPFLSLLFGSLMPQWSYSWAVWKLVLSAIFLLTHVHVRIVEFLPTRLKVDRCDEFCTKTKRRSQLGQDSPLGSVNSFQIRMEDCSVRSCCIWGIPSMGNS